jgi:beta-lactamase superfamily II metal-dependent hydrolase
MVMRLIALCLGLSSLLWGAGRQLEAYFIDVEGGQATLLIAPSGESMLIDTGWPGFDSRDAKRIAKAAEHAGVKQIDYLLVTHFHVDHAGGVPQLAALLPIRNFIDHGESVERDAAGEKLYKSYMAVRARGHHIEAAPGTVLPIRGVRAEIVAAAGRHIEQPLPGAGQPNPFCAATKLRDVDPSENAQSVGTVFTFGRFRMVDLGDLTWNKEYDLMCPKNRLGQADVYVVTHHGMNLSGTPAVVAGLHPRVAVMDNGATKGGTAEAWDAMHHTAGLQDIWQLHFAQAGGSQHNAPETYIANLRATPDAGDWIHLTAFEDGSFRVENGRNGFTKTYPAR